MMMVKFRAQEFARDLRKFQKMTGENLDKLVTRQARAMTHKLVVATPPKRPGPGVLSQSLGEQHRIGKEIAKAEVLRTHMPAKNLYRNPKKDKRRARARYLALVASGNVKAVEAFLHGVGLRNVVVLKSASEAHHDSQRIANGHVRKRPVVAAVIDAGTIQQLVKTKQDHVMQAKAGWMVAVRSLKVTRIPKSVSKHNSPGGYLNLGKPFNPRHRVINRVDYAQGWVAGIIPPVIHAQRLALNAQLRKWMSDNARRFRR